MMQKFPFNHFLKLDNLPDSAPVVKDSVNPVIIEQGLKNLASENRNSPRIAPEFGADELKTITEAVLEHIKNLINPNKFHAYFANAVTVASIQQDRVEFLVTTSFIKKMVETHYEETIRQALREILGKDYQVEFEVLGSPVSLSSNTENILNTLKTPAQPAASRKPESVRSSTFFIEDLQPTKDDLIKAVDSKVIEHLSSGQSYHLDANKTFENFIIGSSNNIAHALSLAVAKDPGKTYPALYIYGKSGLGKTHLIHAIANHLQRTRPQLRIAMISANKFMNEMVDAMKDNLAKEFLIKYTEKTDVLIIDDIHELKNKVTTQEKFFHVFNGLMDRGKQLVFTSDKTPKEIDGIEERIRTRLSSALPVEIQQPDLETRIAILKRKAVERDIYLGDDVVTLIARCVKSSIRELEGCLIKLEAVKSILRVDIDLELAKEHLKLNEELENQKNLTIESISKAVAAYYKIPLGDLRGKTKTKEIALPRQVAMYLINKFIKPTLKENGHYFSGRDHSTVLHAINSIQKRIKTESLLAQQVLDLEKQL